MGGQAGRFGCAMGLARTVGSMRVCIVNFIANFMAITMGMVVSGLDYATPFKRKPGMDLTPEQRKCNNAHCMVRIRVENGIRRVKVFRIMKETYRNKLKKYDRINDITCGVVNQTILLKRDGII